MCVDAEKKVLTREPPGQQATIWTLLKVTLLGSVSQEPTILITQTMINLVHFQDGEDRKTKRKISNVKIPVSKVLPTEIKHMKKSHK